MRAGRSGAVARGIAALIVLIALTAGLPVLLYRFGGSPVPHIGSWHRVAGALGRRDNGSLFLAAVRELSWLAWAAFAVAVLTEAQAALRGRQAPRLLGGFQVAVGKMVAVAALAFSSPAAVMLAGAPAMAATHVVGARPQPPQLPGRSPELSARSGPATGSGPSSGSSPVLSSPVQSHALPQASPAGGERSPEAGTPAPLSPRSQNDDGVLTATAQRVAVVEPGQCLWTIAQQHLGDGSRYPEITALNLGRDMGHGQVFTNPAVIQPGWMLRLPAGAASPGSPGGHSPWHSHHDGHPSGGPHFGQPHHAAGHSGPGAPAGRHARTSGTHSASGHPGQGNGAHSGNGGSHSGGAAGGTGSHASQSAGQAPPAWSSGPAASGGAGSGPAPGSPAAAAVDSGTVVDASSASGPAAQHGSALPAMADAAIFGAGMLAGGAAVTLARMRHAQRQARRPGRRIPLPCAAPVAEAEQRLRVAQPALPATTLRAALSDLGSALTVSGQQLPGIAGIHLTPDAMELLLTSPASDPPPEPFTIPGGRQGMAWHLALPAPAALRGAGERADLMPGLFTAGRVAGDGFLLLDLEHLMVTAVQGPPDLVDRVVATAAAELATSQLSGWYDLILCGCPELEVAGGRGTACASLDEAISLLTAKADSVRWRLGDERPADIRYRRITEPLDEDWTLTLLVSRTVPDPEQMEDLLDLACGPDTAGIAILIAAGEDGGQRAPARFELSDDPAEPGAILGRILPMQLEVHPEPLGQDDYQDLVSLFTVAADLDDVPADAPPYRQSVWLPPPLGYEEPGEDALPDDVLPDEAAEPAGDGQYPGGAGPHGDADGAGFGGAGFSGAGFDDAVLDGTGLDGPALDDAVADGSDYAGAWPDGTGTDGSWADGTAFDGTAFDGAGHEGAGHDGTASDSTAYDSTGLAGPQGWPAADMADHAGDQGLPAGPETAGTAAAGAARGQAQPDRWSRPALPMPAPATSSPLRVGVLGAFTVNGAPGSLLPAQSQLLLALALHLGTGLSNSQLCFLLGADPDHPKPTDSLRQLIARTRRQLGRAADGREWITHLGSGQYALHPDTRFDLAELDALAERGLQTQDRQDLRDALDMVRGLPFTGADYWWLDPAFAEAARAQIVDAAALLADIEIDSGNPSAAIRAARTGLAGDACAEQLWRGLMRAEHAAGNLAGVREAWNRCLQAIADIAPGGEPHPDTAALYQQLTWGTKSQPATASV